MTATTTPRPRGFAAMSPEKRLELARRGGKAVRPENRSFAKNRDLAATAGRKGGEAYRPTQDKAEG